MIEDQPTPVRSGRPSIHDLVSADIAERKRVGLERYGTHLQAGNGRDALIDLYQEILDAACYARQLLEERDPGREREIAELRAELVTAARAVTHAENKLFRSIKERDAAQLIAQRWRTLVEGLCGAARNKQPELFDEMYRLAVCELRICGVTI